MVDVFKIVHQRDGVLRSAILMGNIFKDAFILRYGLNKKTTAPSKYPEALPMAFDTFENAFDFYNETSLFPLSYEIYKAEASAVHFQPHISKYYGLCAIADFWKGISIDIVVPPSGTVMCKDITLLKRVWPLREPVN